MPDPLDYESPVSRPARAARTPPTNAQLAAQAAIWATSAVVLAPILSLITVGYLNLTGDPIVVLFVITLALIATALACGKFGRCIVQILDRKFANLPAVFSILAIALAGLTSIALLVVCLSVFFTCLIHLRS